MPKRVYGFLQDVLDGVPYLISPEGYEIPQNRLDEADSIILFTPGSDVTILSVALPVRNEREARQAAPFAVEDDIAVSLGDVHLALGPVPTVLEHPRDIHVVSNSVMQEWTEALAGSVFEAAELVAEQSAVPEGSVLATSDRYVAHLDAHAFSLEADAAPSLVDALLNGHQPVQQTPQALLQTLVNVSESTDERINLRQGVFAGRRHHESNLKPWKLSAALAAGFILLWGISGLIEVNMLNTQAEEIERTTEERFRSAFPDIAASEDYRRALSRLRAERSQSRMPDFQTASTILYTAIENVPGARLQSLRYDAERDGLVASIAYAAYGDDVSLKTVLEQSGFEAELGNLRQGAEGVVGDVRIGGARS